MTSTLGPKKRGTSTFSSTGGEATKPPGRKSSHCEAEKTSTNSPGKKSLNTKKREKVRGKAFTARKKGR